MKRLKVKGVDKTMARVEKVRVFYEFKSKSFLSIFIIKLKSKFFKSF